jgi:MFS superfamily sulfate permease-like transporter
MLSALRDRVSAMRFDLPELSGGLGDLGTFVPIAASLIIVCGMDGGSVLFFAGLANILAGVAFNQPLPVQPMKAIAAVAIAEGLAPGEIAAAGFLTGAIVLALALTGLVTVAEHWIPRPVVRGIQLGVGLKLAAKGMAMALAGGWGMLDGHLLALGATLLVLSTARRQRFPSALILFVAGIVLIPIERIDALTQASLGWSGPVWIWPTLEQWQLGLTRGALPQLPLTLLNSVIAVCALSGDLFPGRAVGTRPMAISVGLMNLTTCLFGAMPSCHGSGGLAGQHRFGARTGGSVVVLGAGKIALGILFGSAVGVVLAAFPAAVLGVLLAFAGLELALPARETQGRDGFFVVVTTAGGILALNAAVGFLLGLGAALLLLRESRSPET